MQKVNFVFILKIMSIFFMVTFRGYSAEQKLSENKRTLNGYNLLDKTKQVIRIDVYNKEAVRYRDINSQLSISLTKKSLNESILIKYSKGEAQALNNLGYYLYKNRMYILSLDKFYNSIKISQKSNALYEQMDSYVGIGLIFKTLKRFDRATLYFQKSLNISKNYKDTIAIIGILVYLGQIYTEEGKNTLAFNNFFYALYYSESYKNIRLTHWVYKNIGNFFLALNQYHIALYYYYKVINENQEPSEFNNIGNSYSLIAHIKELYKEYSDALFYNRLALRYRLINKQTEGVTSSLLNIGHTFMLMKKHDSAMIYLDSGLIMANAFNKNNLKEYGYRNLYYYYSQLKDWKKALKAYEMQSAAKDSLLSQKTRNDIMIYETNETLNEQEKRNTILEQENSIQKLKLKNNQVLFGFSGFLLMIITSVSIYFIFQNNRNRKARIIQELFNRKLSDEVTSRIVAEEYLRKNELQYQFITDNSIDMISRISKNFVRLYVSPSCELLFGYTPGEMNEIGDQKKLIHPDFIDEMTVNYQEMVATRKPFRFVYKALRKGGTWFWAESNVNPIFDDTTGELKEMISVLRDVTERIDQEEALVESSKQKEVLMHEIHHRIKNNFSVLSSLTNMHKDQIQDQYFLNLLDGLQFRIRTMSLVHEQLYRTRNINVLMFSDYLSNLVKSISTAFANDRITISTDLSDEYLSVDTVLPLGLIVNELLTNAYKYAFPGNRMGKIWIEYVPVSESSRNKKSMRRLTVKDNGVGFSLKSKGEKSDSMGTQIIEILSRQLEGEIVMEGDQGFTFSLLFPVEKIENIDH